MVDLGLFTSKLLPISPLSIIPSPLWLGYDGNWSTFPVKIGTPPQKIEAYISTSTAAFKLYAQHKQPDGDNIQNPLAYIESFTWDDYCDEYDCTEIVEADHPVDRSSAADDGQTRFDTITLEVNATRPSSFFLPTAEKQTSAPEQTTVQVVLEDQRVNTIERNDYSVASWGIRPGINYPYPLSVATPATSFIQDLKDNGKIPSISWGYTAGAYYQSQGNKISEASLTLGGYDVSRFEPNNVTFPLDMNATRDIVVTLDSIISTTDWGPLLSEPITLSIDSSVSHLWLPEKVCAAFVQTFGLTYDEKLDLYVVNDSVHHDLQSRRPDITFILSDSSKSDSGLVTINLPYSAFDLAFTAHYPDDIPSTTHYFPIRHTSDPGKYTLGRTFLQEAYLIVDYDRGNFSLHQAVFPEKNISADFRLILDPGETNMRSRRCLSTPATCLLVIAVIYWTLAIVFCVQYRRRTHRRIVQSPARIFPKYDVSCSLYGDKSESSKSKAVPREIGHYKLPFGQQGDPSRSLYRLWARFVPDSVESFRLPMTAWALRHILRTKEGQLFQRVYKVFNQISRPAVPPQSHRREWTCDCGAYLYADFADTNPDSKSAGRLLTGLGRGTPYTTPQIDSDNGSGAAPSLESVAGRQQSDTGSSQRNADDSSSQKSSSIQGSSGPGSVVKRLEWASFPTSNLPAFLYLCVNTGRFAVSLAEIDVRQVRTDGELFCKIWERYQEIRGFRVRRILLRPCEMHFVYFGVQQRHVVGIYRTPSELPPEAEVLGQRWHYFECPALNQPPIPSHLFMHNLYTARRLRDACLSLGTHSGTTMLNRIPKKLGNSIFTEATSGAEAFGWGIHIVEGPNMTAVCWILTGGLIVSFFVSVLYACISGVQDQGFDIGSWLMSVIATFVTALYFHWKESL